MCDNCSFKSKEDETTVIQAIERINNKTRKGFLACLKNGKLNVDPDVLVQCLRSASPAPAPSFQEKNRDAPDAAESYSGQLTNPPIINVESVLLRTLLRRGRISYDQGDLQVRTPEFTVPENINQSLLQNHGACSVAEVTITSDKNGQLRCYVDPKVTEVSRSRYEGLQIADNETVMLKTLIRNGVVSLQENDVHLKHGNWQIPKHIIDSLKAEYSSTPKGELYIISDEKQNLRCIVKIGTINHLITLAKKKYKGKTTAK